MSDKNEFFDVNDPLMEFLEFKVKDILEQKPKKIAIAYLSEDNTITLSYRQCTYVDLQRIGQEMINEGTLHLIAGSKNRIESLIDEYDSESSDQ